MPRNIFSYYDSETGNMFYGEMSENATLFWNALATESTINYQNEQHSAPVECGFVVGAIPGALEGGKVAVQCCIIGAPAAQQFFGFITVPAGIALGMSAGGLMGAAACTLGVYTCDAVSCPVTTLYHRVVNKHSSANSSAISDVALIERNDTSTSTSTSTSAVMK